MTEYTHEQIAALLAGRTQGEWYASTEHGYGYNVYGRDDIVCIDTRKNNAEFIAAAPDIVAQLLARVEVLEAENELLRQSRDGLLSLCGDAAPFIQPVNRQLSYLLEGIRAVLREVADD